MADLIEFDGVVKKFNGKAVLDGVSFGVRKGEILCVVGPSGTGKSVTLKHIVRLLTPTSGRVLVDGIDVASADGERLEELRNRIGYLFQGGALLAWMDVEDNVALPLREKTKLSEFEIYKRVHRALRDVELEDAAEKFPAEISGGMQKRAGLARAVVRDAEIVLYDEPTSGLDPVTSVTIHRLIRKLNRERGITSIVVTHDLNGALNLADRILLLKGGKVVTCQVPAEFVKNPDPAVREFLAAVEGRLD